MNAMPIPAITAVSVIKLTPLPQLSSYCVAFALDCSVLKGSVLGSVGFILYTEDTDELFHCHHLQFHVIVTVSVSVDVFVVALLLMLSSEVLDQLLDQ